MTKSNWGKWRRSRFGLESAVTVVIIRYFYSHPSPTEYFQQSSFLTWSDDREIIMGKWANRLKRAIESGPLIPVGQVRDPVSRAEFPSSINKLRLSSIFGVAASTEEREAACEWRPTGWRRVAKDRPPGGIRLPYPAAVSLTNEMRPILTAYCVCGGHLRKLQVPIFFPSQT